MEDSVMQDALPDPDIPKRLMQPDSPSDLTNPNLIRHGTSHKLPQASHNTRAAPSTASQRHRSAIHSKILTSLSNHSTSKQEWETRLKLQLQESTSINLPNRKYWKNLYKQTIKTHTDPNKSIYDIHEERRLQSLKGMDHNAALLAEEVIARIKKVRTRKRKLENMYAGGKISKEEMERQLRKRRGREWKERVIGSVIDGGDDDDDSSSSEEYDSDEEEDE